MREFRLYTAKLMDLEARGLVAIKVGNRVYYSRRQLEQLLGILDGPNGGSSAKAT